MLAHHDAFLGDINLCHASRTEALSVLVLHLGQIKHILKSGHIPVTDEMKLSWLQQPFGASSPSVFMTRAT